MSYCRIGPESDVYMFTTVGSQELDLGDGAEAGDIVCCGCLFAGGTPDEPTETERHFKTPGGAIEHLRRHVRAGHKVPDSAIARLQSEIDAGRK